MSFHRKKKKKEKSESKTSKLFIVDREKIEDEPISALNQGGWFTIPKYSILKMCLSVKVINK